MGDNVSALTLVAGVMAALLARERSGRGQLVSTSLLRAGIYSIGMDVSTRLGLGRLGPTPSRTRPQNPLMNPYRAGDDRWFWLIGAEAERHWPMILDALGEASLGTDERYRTPRDRRRNAEALVADLDRIFGTRTRAEWGEIFVRHGVWWAPVNTVDDLLEDPQVLASGAFVTSGGDDGAKAPLSVASPIDFGEHESMEAVAPPRIGQHTDAVLREIGVSETDLARLRAAEIIA